MSYSDLGHWAGSAFFRCGSGTGWVSLPFWAIPTWTDSWPRQREWSGRMGAVCSMGWYNATMGWNIGLYGRNGTAGMVRPDRYSRNCTARMVAPERYGRNGTGGIVRPERRGQNSTIGIVRPGRWTAEWCRWNGTTAMVCVEW